MLNFYKLLFGGLVLINTASANLATKADIPPLDFITMQLEDVSLNKIIDKVTTLLKQGLAQAGELEDILMHAYTAEGLELGDTNLEKVSITYLPGIQETIDEISLTEVANTGTKVKYEVTCANTGKQLAKVRLTLQG